MVWPPTADPRAGLDHECVDIHRVDRALGFDPKAVGQSDHDERHREDQPGADYCDHQAPPSPLHVPQCRDSMARTLPIYARSRSGFFVTFTQRSSGRA